MLASEFAETAVFMDEFSSAFDESPISPAIASLLSPTIRRHVATPARFATLSEA
jgi:hypothetical protein